MRGKIGIIRLMDQTFVSSQADTRALEVIVLKTHMDVKPDHHFVVGEVSRKK